MVNRTIYIKYAIFAFLSVIADILAILLAPLVSLPIFIREDVWGREYVVKPFKWLTTHDAPVDAGHVDNYWKTPKTALGRWWSRVRWIWRNPAYAFDHSLGYSQEGVILTKHKDNRGLRYTGVDNEAYWTATNAQGKEAFFYEKQSKWKVPFINKFYFLEQQYGWKLYRNDEDKKCMLALRWSPFKRYDKKEN